MTSSVALEKRFAYQKKPKATRIKNFPSKKLTRKGRTNRGSLKNLNTFFLKNIFCDQTSRYLVVMFHLNLKAQMDKTPDSWTARGYCFFIAHIGESAHDMVGFMASENYWIPLSFGWLLNILLMDKILHQLIGSLSHYLQGFIHTRQCRISSINSIKPLFPE